MVFMAIDPNYRVVFNSRHVICGSLLKTFAATHVQSIQIFYLLLLVFQILSKKLFLVHSTMNYHYFMRLQWTPQKNVGG